MADQRDGAVLAEILFPGVKETPEQIFKRYPPRQLPSDAIVTRFAPSPTGFIHVGSIYISLVGKALARQSQGVFILRVEDTDQQRKLEKGVEEIVSSLLEFDVVPDEGPFQLEPLAERGGYGPYQQSQRKAIYQAFAKQMVAEGLAYPSFQSQAELAAIQEEQKKARVKPGYYGPWAKDRSLSVDEVSSRVKAGEGFVIRYRASYPTEATIAVEDAIRGTLTMPENDQDYVLLKSDGLPTYHMGMPIDDTLMRINLILRADEWLATLPLHVQIFGAIHQPVPLFAHIAPIGKQEGSSKRKLSKRKDPEAAVSYYHQAGYPKEAIAEYLMNIANSSFEAWREQNPGAPIADFRVEPRQMSASIALFNLDKLDSIGKDIIAGYSAPEVYGRALAWARVYDPDLAAILEADPDYSVRVFNIERTGEAPRKDLAHWSDIYPAYGFFFDPLFERSIQGGYQMPGVKPEHIADVLAHLLEAVRSLPDKETWLADLRSFSESAGFAPNRGAYKKAPDQYKGQFSDMMMIYRVALANQHFTPDLYEMHLVMGLPRVQRRLAGAKAAYERP